MVEVYISLGGNMGDRERNLLSALEMLDKVEGIAVGQYSSIYETDPVGLLDQPPFLNQVAKIHTSLTPDDLLKACQGIEQALGRERVVRWGPRIIDLDILLYGNEVVTQDNLVIPHPELEERAFVVVPLKELSSNIVLPSGIRAGDLARKLAEKQNIYLHKSRDDVTIALSGSIPRELY